MKILYYFYAPTGRFEPCGMFTPAHILSISLCIIAVIAILRIAHKKQINFVTKKYCLIFAIVLTCLELIKITHSFIYNETHLDAWFPLSYCGLLIFALWIKALCNGKIEKAANAFISFGCPVAGLLFMIFPTTSLMSFPVWHYFSIYSLFYHSLMLLLGLNSLISEPKLSPKTYLCYLCFVFVFSIPAISMNSIYGSNLMNFREPYNIPIDILHQLHDFFEPAYIALVMIIYMLIPIVTEALKKLFKASIQRTKISTP